MIDPALLHTLLEAGHKAASADNSQPWCFKLQQESIALCYDTARVAGKTFAPQSPATLIAMGAVLENITTAANAAGLQCQTTLSQDFTEGHYANITVTGTPINNAHEIIHSLPLFTRHTNRHAFQKTPCTDTIDNAISTQDRAQVHVFNTPEQIKSISTLVKSASEIRFQTQEVHEWLIHSLRFLESEADKGDGLDLRTLDLPPGGSLFLRFIANWQRMSRFNTIGGYKILSGIDSAPVAHAPALIAITDDGTAQGAINAGRRISRVWASLNAAGLAVHPYFVVADQLIRLQEGTVPPALINQAMALKSNTDTLLQLNDTTQLYMMFRVGYAKKNAFRSQRLPLENLVHQN